MRKLKSIISGACCCAFALFGTATTASALTQAELDAVVEAAEQYWIASGLTAEQIAALDQATYSISDLADDAVGVTDGFDVLIDVDANGLGWFVDSTPLESSEFTVHAEVTSVETGETPRNSTPMKTGLFSTWKFR